ncbi:MAG: hypothetical protein P8186_31025 [Anaerolineae bacterium]|jgi:hypothetical protein
MSIQTGIRLFSLPLIFGTLGVIVASYSGTRGFLALLVGCIISLVLTELFYVPNVLEQWERTGAPGDLKTPEQQKVWEQEKVKHGKKRILSILAGLTSWALLKNYTSPEFQLLFVTTIPGGIAAWILRTGWLIYQKRGRLGP